MKSFILWKARAFLAVAPQFLYALPVALCVARGVIQNMRKKTNFNLTAEQIIKKIAVYPCKTVVLTGGEPTEQNLQPLLKLLKKNKYHS